MARTNKYSTLNFNDIYEKKNSKNNNSSTSNPTSSPANNVNKTIISNSRIHGNMLVLTRPTPKPISIPPKKQQQDPVVPVVPVPMDRIGSEPDLISLRPQGRTGPGLGFSSSPLPSPVGPVLPLKSNKFIPPHLRPGFVSREEKPRPGSGGKVMAGGGYRQGQFGSSGEDRRPKSGGGYDRMRRSGRSGETDPVAFMNRPGSSGTRPNSSGY